MECARNYSAIARQYAEDVTSRKILACIQVKQACQRHLDDLEWQDDKEFDFRFDDAAAAKACRFIELMPHTKGKWASKGEKLVLQPWQIFMTCCVFGWLRKRDGLRRFRRAMLLVPRKNGKSAWAAAVGLYMLVADGEYGAEVYSGATSEKQAWEVFKPARLMALKTPQLLSHYGLEVNAKNLHVIKDSAKFEPIIGNPGDGASPSCAIVDEYHEHDTDRMFDTMETGMGARDQPLMLIITTAGDNIQGPCYRAQLDAQAVLSGQVKNDEFFALIYTIDTDDDPMELDTWKKANPNFGVSVSEDFLKARLRESQYIPTKAATYKTKHLNVWVQSKEAYYDVPRYEKAKKTVSLGDFDGQECIIGVDLAEKTDLAAVEILFRDGEEYTRFGMFYCSEEVIERPENERYRHFRDTGRLIQIDGATTDFRVIQDDIEDLMVRFDVREIVFDPWHSRQIAVELDEAGAKVIEFRGSPSNFNEPMRQLEALIAQGNMHHDGDPFFSWQLGNVVNGTRAGELHRPAKERDENKIDGPVACIMALARWLLDEAAPKSPWDDEGFSIMEAAS